MTEERAGDDEGTIELSLDRGIATLWLDRPASLNALNSDLIIALRDAFADFRSNKDVRVVVIKGRGRGFCAGLDLKDPRLAEFGPSARWGSFHALMDQGLNGVIRDIYEFDRPTIAAVNGLAAGGGIGIALAADLTLACRSAYFVQVFAPQLGLAPDLGCTWQIPRRIGRARSIGLALLGERLPAQQAADWGLIWKAVEDEALEAETQSLAERLRDGAPQALAVVPGMIDRALGASLSEQLDHERDVQFRLFTTEDFREAVTAFKDKRKPVFKGD